MASAPLPGGELAAMVGTDLVKLIRPGLTPAQACILATVSCPGVTLVLLSASSAPHWREAAEAVAQPRWTQPVCGRSLVYSPPSDPAVEERMRVRHQRAAQALGVTVESDGEFWGWAGRTLGAPARTAADAPVWLRLVAEREEKASGKLWTGAVDAQRAFGDLDGHRPALVGLYDETEDGTAYRAELSVRVGAPVLSTTPVLGQDLGLPATWWAELAETLHRLAMSAPTDRIAIRPQCMARAIPQFVGIPAPEVTSWAPAHGDLH